MKGSRRVAGASSEKPVSIVVTGLGLATSLGFGVERNWERLLAGDSEIRVLPEERFALPVSLPVRLGAAVEREALAGRIRKAVPRGVWNTSEQVCHLWLLAALEAMAAAGLPVAGTAKHRIRATRKNPSPQDTAPEETAPKEKSPEKIPADPERTGIYVGCGGGAHGFSEQEHINLYTAEKAIHRDVSRFAIPMYMSSALAGQLSIVAGTRGPAIVVNTACSSGLTALLSALDALRLGRIDRAVVGGVDLTLSAASQKGFYNLGALSSRQKLGARAASPFDEGRDGIVLGEGAACLVLETAGAAAQRGAKALASVLGGAANAEAHHLLSPRENGEGMEACMKLALADANIPPGRIAHVYSHGTGTRYNDLCEAAALERLFPDRPTVSASKELLGHTLGAAGAVDAVLAVLSLRSGRVVPFRHLETLDAQCAINPARETVHPILAGAHPIQAGRPDGSGQDGTQDAVLVNSFAFGGHNSAAVFAPARNGGTAPDEAQS